ncbi:MAG: rhomboid family intramembrane serine protease [Hyphomicrobiales bacterium]
MSARREPILNLPNVITTLILLMGLVHFVRSKLVSEELDLEFLATFAFIPVRYLLPAAEDPFPGGTAAEIADFVTYAFIHGDWTHFLVNAVWLAAFGSAVAWRFGALRFLAFSAITAAAAAGIHMLTHWGEAVPLVGASGAISGHMAAAVRFVFVERGPLGAIRGQGPARFRRPAISLARAFLDRRALAMIVAFFVVNFLFGSISLPMMGEDQVMAWEAHLGGFVAGLVLFRFFRPGRHGRAAGRRRWRGRGRLAAAL